VQEKYRETYRQRIPKKLQIPSIHGVEILHRRDEDVDFDYVGKAGASSFDDGREVGQGALLIFFFIRKGVISWAFLLTTRRGTRGGNRIARC